MIPDCFHKLQTPLDISATFPDPFLNAPAEIAQAATLDLQKKIKIDDQLSRALDSEGGGKMFGVLVVRTEQGEIGYLAAYSGMLSNHWKRKGFAPPVFDVDELHHRQRYQQDQLDSINAKIRLLEDDPQHQRLQRQLADYRLKAEQRLSDRKIVNRSNKVQRDIQRQAIQSDAGSAHWLDQLASQSQREKSELKSLKITLRSKVESLERNLEQSFLKAIQALKVQRKKLSQAMHKEIFDSYLLHNHSGQTRKLTDLFDNELPPGGTADCAAPKLFQFASLHKMNPVALAEFWWGATQKNELRFKGHFYPPCRRKCSSILPFYLEALDLEKTSPDADDVKLVPEIVFEDDNLLVLNKPAGMLSVPGKTIVYSVANWLSGRYPENTGPMLVHRLDMATSGILLAAKNALVHQHLQKQFMQRCVDKRYVAVLSKAINIDAKTIRLPLRVNLDDRPRQMVCHQHGKSATTRVELIQTTNDTSRVYLYPETGRTHQLRVHAAHADGLDAAILGDSLYGEKSARLYLHAEKIRFRHPITDEIMQFEVPAGVLIGAMKTIE